MSRATYQQRVDFFIANAGYSYHPPTESSFVGRVRCAMRLAAAEEWLQTKHHGYAWEIDDHDSSDFNDDQSPWALWFVALSVEQSCGHLHVVASLGGIDFGRAGDPHTHCYGRVVQAELALEAMPS